MLLVTSLVSAEELCTQLC